MGRASKEDYRSSNSLQPTIENTVLCKYKHGFRVPFCAMEDLATDCNGLGKFFYSTDNKQKCAKAVHFTGAFASVAIARSSCSKAEDMRSISLLERPVSEAVLRECEMAAPTSRMITRACAGFNP